MALLRFPLVLLASISTVAALLSQPDLAGDVRRALDNQHEAAPLIEGRASVPAGFVAAPYYPTPKGGWVASWKDSYAKAQKLVSNMTLAEKVNITSGSGYQMGPCTGNVGSADRLGIPRLCLQDSALGIRNTQGNTAFPAGITTGATFNKQLMYDRGFALGQEARGKGINIQLGPTVGPLGRKPRGGRNWEGFGADPVLQAIGGAATIKGMQANGVIATIKHWLLNEQESYRMDLIPHGLGRRGISSNADDRTLHELYAWPFAEGIRAGVGAVMSSYNEVNGSACSQNSKLINGILKDELGYQGFVMTDWFAQIGGVSSALAGNDMAMPGDGSIPLFGQAYWASELSRSVLNGTVPLERLNDMVTRIVAAWYQMGQDQDYPPPNFSAFTTAATDKCYPGAVFSPQCTTNLFVDVQANHKLVARDVAREGITLLKNSDNVLPLSSKSSFKVFGSDAQTNPDGPNACTDRQCNKGVLGMGWGSGTANYPYIDAPIDAIKRVASNVTYYSSDNFPSGLTVSQGDIAIVFISSDSGEDASIPGVEGNYGDRTGGLQAWHGGDNLVKAAAAKYSTVVVVVHTVGPIIVEPWIDLPSVKALVFAHLPGQEAGESLTDILFGKYSPSGHLPYSMAKAESDYPDSLGIRGFDLFQVQDTFSEGLYIDYRSLNKRSIKPRFAFGHGLSYTTFSKTSLSIKSVVAPSTFPPARQPKGSTPVYSTAIPPAAEVDWPKGLNRIMGYLYPYFDNPQSVTADKKFNYPAGYQTTPQPDPPAGGSQGGNPALWDTMFTISVDITNTGKSAGKDVAMLFVQYPTDSTFDTPPIQLRTFEKTKELSVGETQTVQLTLTRKDLSVWDTVAQNWRILGGGNGYVFWIGNSSANLTVACESTSLECSAGRSSPVV